MKIFQRITALSVIIGILVSFSGCSFKFSSFDTLIRPPKLSGKYQGLQDSFEKKVKNFSLITPENGLYQSAFVPYDINADGEEEAFVFYKTEETNDIVNMYYFIFKNNEWIPVCNSEGFGNSVDLISFCDLNGDKKSEIVVGWTLFSSKTNKVFSVYSQNNESLIQLSNYPYSSLKIVDINGNGIDDIFTLSVTSTVENETTASAKAYSYDKKSNTMSIIGETKTDSNISSYDNILVENNNGENILYIDSSMGDNGMFTDVIYWDDNLNSLVSPLFDSTTQSTRATWRSSKISCSDINGDSLIEIPASVEMKGSSVNNSSESNTDTVAVLYFTKWFRFSNDELTPLCYSVINEDYQYLLEIKSSWVGRITIVSSDGQWDFYRYDSYADTIGDLLFSIYVYDKSSTTISEKYKSFKILKSTSNLNYSCSITNEGTAFGVSETELENNFRIFNIGG